MKSALKPAVPSRVSEPARTLEDLISVRIVRLSEAIARLASRTFETQFGLRNTDLRILNILDGANGISVNEIARRAHVDKAWVSRSLRELEERGLVRRGADKSDSRVSIIDLTARGRGLLDKVRPVALASEARLLAGVDGESFKRDLDRLMATVEAALEDSDGKSRQ